MKTRLFRICMPVIAAVLLSAAAVSGCGDAKQVNKELAGRKTGLEYIDKDDYDNAILAFNKALGERAGIVSNLEEDINFYKAFAQIEAGKTQDAIRTYTALIEYDEKNADAYYLRGCAYISTGKNKQAVSDFEQASKAKKDSGAMCAGIYEQLMSAGLSGEAASYLKQGLELKGDDAASCLARGKLYLLSGDYEKAETELGNALELKDPAANLYLGRLFQAQDKGEEARSYYEAYLQDNPNDSKVLYELGQIAFLQGNFEEAVSWFEQGLSCKNILNKRALWTGRIAALEYAGNFPGALDEVNRYLEQYPNDAAAQKELLFLQSR